MVKRAHIPVAERREQLTQAAMQVMRREGAWALTTRAVAKEAGVPLGSVHYAFDSKMSLLRAVFGTDIESTAAVIGAALNTGSDPHEMLREAVGRYADVLRADPLAELVFQELGLMGVRDDHLRELSREAVEGYRSEIVSFLNQVALAAQMSWDAPVEVVAELLFGQLVGLAQNWLCTGREELLEACLDDATAQLVKRLA